MIPSINISESEVIQNLSTDYNKYNLTKTMISQAATCELLIDHLDCKNEWNNPYIPRQAYRPVEVIQEINNSKIDLNHTSTHFNLSKIDNFKFVNTIIERSNQNNITLSSKVENIPQNNMCIKNEPSVASNGYQILYTGNHYASISHNNGSDWQFIDPGNNFPFCCDQRVIYDEKTGIFVWYIQGERVFEHVSDNLVRIALSNDTVRWDVYDFWATGVNTTTLYNKFLDFPNLATDDKYFYLTSNLVNYFSDNSNQGSFILRIPLEHLLEIVETPEFTELHGEFFYDPEARTITPVKGATDEMYFATLLTDENKMKIYNMNQSSTLKEYETNIHEFIKLQRNGTLDCGANNAKWGWWCGSFNSKITTGWINDDKIGFLWSANKFNATDTNYTGTYIDGTIIDLKDMSEIDRPYIYSSNNSLGFADVAFNGNGKLGIILFYGNKTNVNLGFGVYKQDSPPHWKVMSLLNSTEKITNPLFDPDFKKCYSDAQKIDNRQFQWGDYITINKFQGDDSLWEIAGFIMDEDNWHGAKPYYILTKN